MRLRPRRWPVPWRPCGPARWSSCPPTRSTAWPWIPERPACSSPSSTGPRRGLARAGRRCRTGPRPGRRRTGPAVQRLMGRWWPGGLTLVVPRRRGLDLDLGGPDDTTIGLRLPDHPVPVALAEAVGPLAVTSANRHGQSTPATAAAVVDQLGPGWAWPSTPGPVSQRRRRWWRGRAESSGCCGRAPSIPGRSWPTRDGGRHLLAGDGGARRCRARLGRRRRRRVGIGGGGGGRAVRRDGRGSRQGGGRRGGRGRGHPA